MELRWLITGLQLLTLLKKCWKWPWAKGRLGSGDFTNHFVWLYLRISGITKRNWHFNYLWNTTHFVPGILNQSGYSSILVMFCNFMILTCMLGRTLTNRCLLSTVELLNLSIASAATSADGKNTKTMPKENQKLNVHH